MHSYKLSMQIDLHMKQFDNPPFYSIVFYSRNEANDKEIIKKIKHCGHCYIDKFFLLQTSAIYCLNLCFLFFQ